MLALMNVMNMKGQLTPQQAAFFADRKPEYELFDLKKDPHEVNNVADDPAYAEIKAAMLSELNNWRENVIQDQGNTEAYFARNTFPASLPEGMKVDDWVKANYDKYNFYESGWPAWYPTRTLEQWEDAVKQWEPYVFRGPSEKVKRPELCHKHRKFNAQKATKGNKKSQSK